MPLDRTGEPVELDDDAYHKAHCSGWLTRPDDDHPRPCLRCKPRFRDGTVSSNDYAEAIPSAAARAAIERADREDRQ